MPAAQQHVVTGAVVAFDTNGARVLLPGNTDVGSEEIDRTKVQRTKADIAARVAACFTGLQQGGTDADGGGFAIRVHRQAQRQQPKNKKGLPHCYQVTVIVTVSL
ncbi:hypothetical protein D3C78_1575680 [compost metagenome]